MQVTERIDFANWEITNEGYIAGRTDMIEHHRGTRVFMVTGLDANSDSVARIKNACEAAGIPKVGEAHPAKDRVWVTSVSGELRGPENCVVTVQYENRPEIEGLLVDIGASGTVLEWYEDRWGNDFTCTTNDGKTVYGVAPYERLDPIVRVTATGYTWMQVLQFQYLYQGTVSNGGFLGGDNRTWRCNAITGRPTGDGNNYTLEFEFQYNPDTWDVVPEWFDSNNEAVLIKDIPKAQRRKQVYRETIFPISGTPL